MCEARCPGFEFLRNIMDFYCGHGHLFTGIVILPKLLILHWWNRSYLHTGKPLPALKLVRH